VSTTILNGIFPWTIRRPTRAHDKAAWPTRTGGGSSDGRWYRVKLDMDRLRAHLSPGSPAKADERALRRWLRQSGFEPRGDWWVVREAGLGQLAPSEVAASEPMN
jgi:hypothetical protein